MLWIPLCLILKRKKKNPHSCLQKRNIFSYIYPFHNVPFYKFTIIYNVVFYKFLYTPELNLHNRKKSNFPGLSPQEEHLPIFIWDSLRETHYCICFLDTPVPNIQNSNTITLFLLYLPFLLWYTIWKKQGMTDCKILAVIACAREKMTTF